eukprot:COSAG04_NODE_8250_length_1001_cov_1.856984_1_plen_31_part_10
MLTIVWLYAACRAVMGAPLLLSFDITSLTPY